VLFSLFFPSGYYGGVIGLTIILTCIGFDLVTTISWEGAKGQGAHMWETTRKNKKFL